MTKSLFDAKDKMRNGEEWIVDKISNWMMMTLWIYGPSCLVLFSVLGWVISLGFQALQEHLGLDLIIDTEGKCLSEFKRCHARLCDASERLSRLFGPILLVWLIYIFTNFISLSYYLAIGLRSFSLSSYDRNYLYRMLSSSFLVIQQSIHLVVIAIVPHRMKQQVNIYQTVAPRTHDIIIFLFFNEVGIKKWNLSTSDRLK